MSTDEATPTEHQLDAGPKTFRLAGNFRARRRGHAVLTGIGALGMGFVVAVGLTFLKAMFSVWGGDADPTGPIVLGIVIAVIGVAGAVFAWVTAPDDASIAIDDDSLTITYPGFGRPFVVPRASVRLVAIDDRPLLPFQPNPRFPVRGVVPDEVFEDALDRSGLSVPPVARVGPSATVEGFIARTDDPSEAGWAANGSAPAITVQRDEAWLFRGDGAALPFLRSEILEVPNVAVVFSDRFSTPRPGLSGRLFGPAIVFQGGGPTSGLLLKVTGTPVLEHVLDSWGVVRDPTADDVLDQHLRLPKPLRGWRTVVYASLIVVPILIGLAQRL